MKPYPPNIQGEVNQKPLPTKAIAVRTRSRAKMMPGMSKQFIRVPRWCSLILSRADNEQVPGLRGVHPRYPAFTTSSVTRTFGRLHLGWFVAAFRKSNDLTDLGPSGRCLSSDKANAARSRCCQLDPPRAPPSPRRGAAPGDGDLLAERPARLARQDRSREPTCVGRWERLRR